MIFITSAKSKKEGTDDIKTNIDQATMKFKELKKQGNKTKVY